MNTQPFRPLYDQLTAEERVQLVLAAVARGDMDEVARLRDSCRRVTAVIGDLQYTELLQGMWLVGAEILCHWLDVSHRSSGPVLPQVLCGAPPHDAATVRECEGPAARDRRGPRSP